MIRLPLVCAALALVWAAPAAAQTPAVVAQSGAATLAAVDRAPDESGRTLELRLQQGPQPDEDVDEQEVVDTPVWPDEVAVLNADLAGNDSSARRILVGGAAPAAAATLDLHFGAARFSVPTVAGDAYRGADAGRIRFFLAELTLPTRSDDEPDTVRLLDAAGRVIGVSTDETPTLLGPVSLGRYGSRRLRAVVRARLAPTPLQPDRVEPELCLVRGFDETCRAPGTRLVVDGESGCGRDAPFVAGFVPDGTRTLIVSLGSGRRVRLRARALPTSLGMPGLYVAGTLPRYEAVRGMRAVDAGARVLARDDEVAAPPGKASCRDSLGDELGDPIVARDFAPHALGTPPGTEVALPYAPGPRLVVREVGDKVCIGFDRLDVDASRCLPPPLSSRITYGGFVTGRIPGRPQRAIGAMVNARVAFVELRLRGGGQLRLPTSAGEGYIGRFRDHVRFVSMPLQPQQVPMDGFVLDAGGRRIGGLVLEPDDERRLARPLTLARAGAARLVAARPIEAGARAAWRRGLRGARVRCRRARSRRVRLPPRRGVGGRGRPLLSSRAGGVRARRPRRPPCRAGATWRRCAPRLHPGAAALARHARALLPHAGAARRRGPRCARPRRWHRHDAAGADRRAVRLPLV